MKITSLPTVFTEALPVLEKINQAGYEAYFVGGSVRDLLLNRHIHDVDIATSAYPMEIKHIFNRTIDTGIKHGTVTILYNGNSYEITTFRTESGYQDYRRPDHVTFVQNLSEDLKRRDFTINALAMDASGNIIDHFDGIGDLRRHVIKAVGVAENRFHEDALRMMRAVRFMSQLEFNLEEKTYQAIKDNHHLLSKISIERIREEFVKMGIGKGSRRAFQVFLDTGLSQEVPCFQDKKDLLSIFPKLTFNPTTEENLWAVMIVLLKVANQDIAKFMSKWKNSNAMERQVARIVEFFDLISSRSPTNYELFRNDLKTILLTIDLSNILGQPVNGSALVDRYENLPIKKQKDLVVNGETLLKSGIPAGPKVGYLLQKITQAVVEGELDNDLDAINQFILKHE
ncbi:tRNA nucleotidyltransferase (CCA-adding enzyme) [Lactobacillus colini]|uniref:CCA-adding enzyme n=1 Tax=Lactobacillus colini TaxID=1819254 RepID=A0ABS4MED1_9LACO|nr:CCA tRNA nucleotidyltransferase [Lactobacillus colini]MBP2057988.1 tRNA nucleotidyltransferase (CCA-adding enzyme) [Lactobacillus colini]